MVCKDTLNRYIQEIKVNCWGVRAKLLRITYESAVKSGNLISVILLLTSRNVVCVSDQVCLKACGYVILVSLFMWRG